jgi:hypothetical protein
VLGPVNRWSHALEAASPAFPGILGPQHHGVLFSPLDRQILTQSRIVW